MSDLASLPSKPIVTATGTPKNKVVAAAAGAASGSALAVILTWLLALALKQGGVTLPDNVEAAFVAVFSTVATLLAGYFTPPGANEGSIVGSDGKVRSGLSR